MRPSALLIAACLAVAGCGGGDDGSARTPAPGSPPQPGVGAQLDADGLDMVHDTLYECLRKAGGGVLARYLNGQASVADSFNNVAYDDRLAAPKAERRLLEAGDAQFIGVRANRRDRADRGHADVDVLIFRSEDEAQKAAQALAQESEGKAEQAGLFVNVTLRDAKGAGVASLERCEGEARP